MESYLLLGGNLGDVQQHFEKAIFALESSGVTIIAKSSLYASESWGYKSANYFLNQVIHIKSTLPPSELLVLTKQIECELGRKTKSKEDYADRIIDIDILYVGNLILNSTELEVPHPRLHLRKFTLLPLAELIPTFIHPLLKQSTIRLLENCPDHSEVTRK